MIEILILGGENAGKSLLIKRIQESTAPGWDCNLSSESTQPTVGVELNEICLKSLNRVSVREIGSALSSQWPKYIPNCSHIIFLIDVADMGHLASAMVLLHEVMLSNVSKKNVLVAFNKLDLVDKRSLVAANNFLRVDDLKQDNRNMDVIYGSCMDGSLCAAVVAWITAQLSS